MPREDTEDVVKPNFGEKESTERGGALEPAGDGGDAANPWSEFDSTSVRPISSDVDPLIGVVAGEYRILEPLGVGSMGLVYRGAHLDTHQEVAIKVLKRALISDPSHARRFLDEARAVASCNHPGIIGVFSVGQLDSDEPYLVMELLVGESLDVQLKREGKLPVREVVELAVPIASALGAAHAAGLIHRDIKPANIFITRRPDGSPFPKLIDFGLAQRNQQGARAEQTSVVGTPLYLAPEQARREPITHRADLYSFGCVLFELLTGKPPFTAGNLHALLDQHASLAPIPLRSVVADVPKSLEKLVLSMLAKNADDRPESALEVRRVLEEVAGQLESGARPTMPLRRGQSWQPTEEKTTVSAVHQPSSTLVEDAGPREWKDPSRTAMDDERPGPPLPDGPMTVRLPVDTAPDAQAVVRRTMVDTDPEGNEAVSRRGDVATDSAAEAAATVAHLPPVSGNRPAHQTRSGEQRRATGERPVPAAGSKERTSSKRTKSAQSVREAAVPDAKPPKNLLPAVIAAAVVVALLLIAIVVKVMSTPAETPVEPKPPKPTPVEVRNPTEPTEATPSEPTPAAPPDAVQPPDAVAPPDTAKPAPKTVTKAEVRAKQKALEKRVLKLPAATRKKAQAQLKEASDCKEAPEVCLGRLQKVEAKFFK